MKRGVSCLSILLGATMLPGAASSQEAATMPPIPPFECEAMVHYDREMKLPGYILPTSAGPRTCIRSEEHTSELQSLMRISYAVFCLKKKKIYTLKSTYTNTITR